MWKSKRFKTFAAQESWIEKNVCRYQVTRLYVNNGYAVEYRKLRKPGNLR